VARYYRTEGICLRRTDYSDTSQVAAFLTPDSGRLSFLAKGVKRAPKKGIRRGFDLLCRYDLVYTKRRSASLYNLTDSTLVESFRGLRHALVQILHGYYAAELALSFTIEEQPCPDLYRALVEALSLFASGRNVEPATLLLEIAALRQHGALPDFSACVECRKPLPAKGEVLFSAPEGGPLCASCQRNKQAAARAMRTQPVHLAVLNSLTTRPVPRAGRLKLDPAQVQGMSRLLRFHIQHVLGKKLTMWQYLSAVPPHAFRSGRGTARAAAADDPHPIERE